MWCVCVSSLGLLQEAFLLQCRFVHGLNCVRGQAGIAADNVVVAVYFITIFAIANRRNMNEARGPSIQSLKGSEGKEAVEVCSCLLACSPPVTCFCSDRQN